MPGKWLDKTYGVPLINKNSAPVEWAGLMYELEDAQEHLTALISEMNATDDFDEVDLRIQHLSMRRTGLVKIKQ